MTQALKTLCLALVGKIPFSPFQPSPPWGNKNWPPQYKDVKVEKFEEQYWLNRLQMVQFECHRHSKPCVSLRLEEFHFLLFCLPFFGVIRIGHFQIRDVKVGKFEEQYWLHRLQMVQLECPRH